MKEKYESVKRIVGILDLKTGFRHRKWLSATCKKEEQELASEGRLGDDADSLHNPNSANSSINISIYHSKECKQQILRIE